MELFFWKKSTLDVWRGSYYVFVSEDAIVGYILIIPFVSELGNDTILISNCIRRPKEMFQKNLIKK